MFFYLLLDLLYSALLLELVEISADGGNTCFHGMYEKYH